MYTSYIENRHHRSMLEHRRRQIADIDFLTKYSVKTVLVSALHPNFGNTAKHRNTTSDFFRLNIGTSDIGCFTQIGCSLLYVMISYVC